MWLSDLQKIGAVGIAIGLVCILIGVCSFCNPRFISLGNIFLCAGTSLMAGIPRTVKYLAAPRRRRGSIVLLVGVLMVARKYAVSGTLVELAGLFLVCAGSAGLIIAVLQSMPIIGPILNSPQVQPIISKFGPGSILPY